MLDDVMKCYIEPRPVGFTLTGKGGTLVRVQAVCAALVLLSTFPTAAMAHQSKVVGPYRFTVGMQAEPPYTDERSGLNLIVRNTADNSLIQGLGAASLDRWVPSRWM